MKGVGVSGPVVLNVAVLHVGGYALDIEDTYHGLGPTASDRPHLVIPEIWIEDLDTVNIDDAVRPLMDMLWQAFGCPRCLDFDVTTGAYSPRAGG